MANLSHYQDYFFKKNLAEKVLWLNLICPTKGQNNKFLTMIETDDNAVSVLTEINQDVHNSASSNKSIEFHQFILSWILNGATEP